MRSFSWIGGCFVFIFMFLDGRTIVITGGGRGIGEEAVKKFLAAGARVIIGCRSPENVHKKFDDLTSGDKDKYPGTVQCFYLDLMTVWKYLDRYEFIHG